MISSAIWHYVRVFTIALSIIFVGLLISYPFLYNLIVLPHIDDWKYIPWHWEIVIFAPLLTSVLFIGIRIRKLSEFFTVASASFLITVAYVLYWYYQNEAGVRNQMNIEGFPFEIMLFYLVFFGVIWIGAAVIRKRRSTGTAAAHNTQNNDVRK